MQLYLKCHAHRPRNKTGRLAAAMFRESVGEWCSCAYGANSSSETIRSLLAHLGPSRSLEEGSDEDDKNSDDAESSDKVKIEERSVAIQLSVVNWFGGGGFWERWS